MTISKDLMANLLLAAGGRGGISSGGDGSNGELTNWEIYIRNKPETKSENISFTNLNVEQNFCKPRVEPNLVELYRGAVKFNESKHRQFPDFVHGGCVLVVHDSMNSWFFYT